MREPITIEERARLKTVYVRYEPEERARRNWSPGTLLWHREQSAIDRLALMRALVECGYLVIRRRRMTPPITRSKALGIT